MTRHLPEQTRRQQILNAASKCFVERGYHPTRMEDIANEAGLSKGGVYFHFESKREVFQSLVMEEYNNSQEFLQSVKAKDTPILEQLTTLAQYFVQGFSERPDAPRFFVVMAEMALRDEEFAKLLRDKQQQFIEEIAGLVQKGVDQGLLREEVNPIAVSTLLKALVDGVEALHALQYPVEVQQLLATGLDLVLEGIVKR